MNIFLKGLGLLLWVATWGVGVFAVAVLVKHGLDAITVPLLRRLRESEKKRADAARLRRLREAARESHAHVVTAEDLAVMREELAQHDFDADVAKELRNATTSEIYELAAKRVISPEEAATELKRRDLDGSNARNAG